MMRIVVDQLRCCGAGSCASIVPEVFDQSQEDGVVILLRESPPERLRPLVAEAAALCPVSAITMLDS